MPKDNEVPTIGLDFSKKQKPRPKTERVSSTNIHSTMNSPSANQKFSVVKNQQNEMMLTLLQKKKQYSMAIREKNMVVGQNSSQNINSSQHQLQEIENVNPLKKNNQN